MHDLSQFTHADVRWAAQNMPLLLDTDLTPLKGLRIAICLHIEPKTAVLCALLVEAGAEVWLTGSPGTTRQDVADWLTTLGVHVHAAADDDAPRIKAVLTSDPQLVLDNGADLIRALLDSGLPSEFRGGTEETTTGALLLRQRSEPPPFPVIVINDSPLKLLVENRWGVGQSVVQGFMNATNKMIPGTRATVAGYGPCGRGVAQTLRQLGARVSVADQDPYRRLEAALDGHQVGRLDTLLADTDLLFLATGHPDVVSDEGIAALPDNAVIAGVGHCPWELDLQRLGPPTPATGAGSARQTADHETYIQPDGRRITVLAKTRMINLVSAGGNPIEAMDLGLTLQARSLALVATGRAAPGVQAVPLDLDREIAETFAATLELS
ncbi:adenosylhomocysteinase [Streptomyces sp. SID13031]|uniref:adenosylhomocysteinase n=1 Tax=Streptomyces sp. SID13031 TaxID=2706046 RepID=UPI0013CA58D7|nr:adenosylhomocysteinase [Streptomyces sp. SID13031]NEA35804.1 adenosylhomocysteinase [Streptomyces sp. SID13031]